MARRAAPVRAYMGQKVLAVSGSAGTLFADLHFRGLHARAAHVSGERRRTGQQVPLSSLGESAFLNKRLAHLPSGALPGVSLVRAVEAGAGRASRRGARSPA